MWFLMVSAFRCRFYVFRIRNNLEVHKTLSCTKAFILCPVAIKPVIKSPHGMAPMSLLRSARAETLTAAAAAPSSSSSPPCRRRAKPASCRRWRDLVSRARARPASARLLGFASAGGCACLRRGVLAARLALSRLVRFRRPGRVR